MTSTHCWSVLVLSATFGPKRTRATSRMPPGPAPPPEGTSTGVGYFVHFMKATTNSFIGSHRVSHPTATLTKHTQDTVNNRYTQACVACAKHKCVSRVTFHSRKWEREVSRSNRQWLPWPADCSGLNVACFVCHGNFVHPHIASFQEVSRVSLHINTAAAAAVGHRRDGRAANRKNNVTGL